MSFAAAGGHRRTFPLGSEPWNGFHFTSYTLRFTGMRRSPLAARPPLPALLDVAFHVGLTGSSGRPISRLLSLSLVGSAHQPAPFTDSLARQPNGPCPHSVPASSARERHPTGPPPLSAHATPGHALPHLLAGPRCSSGPVNQKSTFPRPDRTNCPWAKSTVHLWPHLSITVKNILENILFLKAQ